MHLRTWHTNSILPLIVQALRSVEFAKSTLPLLRSDDSTDPAQLSCSIPCQRKYININLAQCIHLSSSRVFSLRFIRESLTPRSFRELRSIDPACGSGIFVRNFSSCNATRLRRESRCRQSPNAFSRAEGIELAGRDACEADKAIASSTSSNCNGVITDCVNLRVKCHAIAESIKGQPR